MKLTISLILVMACFDCKEARGQVSSNKVAVIQPALSTNVNIPPFLTGDPLDVGHQHKPTNVVIVHYNSWGQPTKKTNAYQWKDTKAQEFWLNHYRTNHVAKP